MKTFKIAGVSKLNGTFALRATNREGDTYAEILKKEGHTDVHLVKLKTEMSKEEIRKYLPGLKAFQEPVILACLKGSGEETKETKVAKKSITKPTQAKGPSNKKKDPKKKDTPAANDASEVATTESNSDDEHIDVAAELGTPAFTKHVTE